jgi:hypothetical protein
LKYLFIFALILASCAHHAPAKVPTLTGPDWSAEEDKPGHWVVFVRAGNSTAETDAVQTICAKRRFYCQGPVDVGKIIEVKRTPK